MDRSDLRRAEILTTYWDDVTLGRAPADPQLVGDDIANLIERLQAFGDLPEQDSARERVRRELAQHPRWKEPDMEASTFSLYGAAGSPLANPPGWPHPALPAARGQSSRSWGPLAQAAIVLLVVTSLIAGYFSLVRRGDVGSPLPGAATPAADTTPGADWPMYRGNPARTGAMAGPGPVGQPIELWRFQTQGPASRSPAIADDVAYLQSGDGHVYALDAATGTERWRMDLGTGPDTPAIVGDTLYVNNGVGTLLALDAANGAERWRFAEVIAPFASPIVVDGVLFTASEEGRFFALDAATGAELWQYESDAGIGRAAAVAAGLVYFGTDNGTVRVVDAATGAERWRFESGEMQEPARTPTVGDGVVYVAIGSTLYAFDAMDGAEQWRTTFDGARPVTAAGDTLYSAGLDGVVYALDAADGAIRWTFNTGVKNPAASAPALVGDTVYAAGADRTLYAIDAATGAERWSFSLDGNVDYGPSVANGVIYVGTNLGSIYAIGGSGTEQLMAPGSPQGSPAPVDAAASPVAPAASAASPWQTTGGPEPLFAVAGGAVDAEGNLWVVDAGNDQIQIIAPDGTFLEAWDGTSGGGERFSFAKSNGGYDGDFAFAPDGRIYVAEPGSASHRVQVFDHDRTWLETWDAFGTGDGQFVEPISVAIDADGAVYVLDLNQRRVQKFDADGSFLFAFGGGEPEEGELTDPAYITVDREGNVLVPEWDHSRIVVFASDGTMRTQWGSFGSEPGQFRKPTDVVTDAMGNVYVADLDNGRIQLLDPNGNALAMWDAGTTPSGQENVPYGLALDGQGNLYVMGVATDYDSEGNVQKFRIVPSLVPAAMATPRA